MDFLALGKKVLFFSMALLTGLFIMQSIIEAHSPQPRDPELYPAFTSEETSEPDGTILDKLIPEHKEIKSLNSVAQGDLQERLDSGKKRGKPVAFLSEKKLYLLDGKANILAPADSAAYCDLPVISGDSLKIDWKRLQVTGEEIEQAMNFIKMTRKDDYLAYANISQIYIHHEIGLIVYTNYANGLPLIVGKGDIEKKIVYLKAFQKQLGNTKLAANARYLDLRLDGQIIVKKANPNI
ncbi:MAG TPA: cell division protein FtsQ/DivIB [bacterium]|nr:cell division protein FtsQ/DivIB [bacterium]HPN41867.1 cell division protein FtsQ/DivIB [bacterium]